GLSGCGYAIGNLYAVKNVEVPVFENNSVWRTNELDLTNAVVRELQAQGIRVGGREAEYELLGTISGFEQPTVVEGLDDEVLVGSLSVQLDILLRNRKTGKTTIKESRVEKASIMSARGENVDTARFEVFDKLAKWVATRMEKPWNE
ncbi:MAG: hypothetical protein A2Z34_02110, partial [Planctomycetes bacterium RBG_16_59_8]